MNLNNQFSSMHFKSAQIAGVEIGPSDMVQINQYSLTPLSPDEIFAFKVSMAANEVDRDYEVFPRATLAKLANLFVGKTVVKDHDHRSDNQIARIYATELADGSYMNLTKNGEVYSELIAKCYMVKTSTNADLISEIRAGIRKEVSLGCRIGRAVCSVCGTDNVKTYCTHFPGKQYEGNPCFFSLEDPKDAYELSFVAIPAQQHAGTVKAYGEKPYTKEDLQVTQKGEKGESENLHTREPETTDDQNDEGTTDPVSAQLSELSTQIAELVAVMTENSAFMTGNDQKTPESARKTQENETKMPENDREMTTEEPASGGDSANLHTREPEADDPENRLIVNQSDSELDPTEPTCTQEETSPGAALDDSSENLHTSGSETGDPENRLTVNRNEGDDPLSSLPETGDEKPLSKTEDEQNRLTVNRSGEVDGTCAQGEEPSDSSTTEQAPHSGGEEQGADASEKGDEDKAKEAEARIRALDLSLSIRKHQQNGGHHE